MSSIASAASTSMFGRITSSLRWRAAAARTRLQQIRTDGVNDHLRCRVELGFALPPLDTMQNYKRLKFLHDCIVRFAPRTGVALEVGCYKCSSTVFIAHACARAGVASVSALDLFTGTRSWNTPIDYYEDARKKLEGYGLADRVTLIRSDSMTYPWKDPIAALHIDADHSYEAVWNDISKFMPFIVEGGIAVFDDYDVSHEGVTKAVHRFLAEDPRFEVVASNYQGVEYGSLCLRRTKK